MPDSPPKPTSAPDEDNGWQREKRNGRRQQPNREEGRLRSKKPQWKRVRLPGGGYLISSDETTNRDDYDVDDGHGDLNRAHFV